jgi:hypothetical protein
LYFYDSRLWFLSCSYSFTTYVRHLDADACADLTLVLGMACSYDVAARLYLLLASRRARTPLSTCAAGGRQGERSSLASPGAAASE